MGVFAWINERKRAVASAGILTTSVLAVTTFAFLYEGFPTTDVELNDGSVWITKSSSLLVGRFNNQSTVLDAGVRALGSDYDVVQDGRTVLVVDETNASVASVDPANVSLAGDAQLPPGAQVALGGETVAILQPDNGAVWVTGAQEIQAFAAAALEPAGTLGAGASVAVAGDGTVFGVSPAEGTVVTMRDGGDGELSVSTATVEGLSEDDEVQIAAAGSEPVVLNTTQSTLWSSSGGTREAPGAADGVLQQSSPDAAVAAYATSTELVQVALGSDETTRTSAGGEGAPAAPVMLNGCLYGAWAGVGRFVRDCAGEQFDLEHDISDLTETSKLTFRVNRDVVVLNDTVGGTAWLAAEDFDRVDDWSAITPPETGEQSEDTETELSEETSLPERTEVNHPPVAQDDDFGVRPGRTTVLPVLDNDSDPDGDVLTASAPSSTAIGEISPVYGGRALQIDVPEGASGSVNFTYEANDGRPGGTDEAVVSVTVRDWLVNDAPVQRKIPLVSVEQGGRITFDALLDWVDPDGDDVFLSAASAEGGHEVDHTSDGQLTFRATGTVQGRTVVTVVVSDGQTEATGTINVDVRPLGSTKPVPTPDHVVLRVGESTTISPLENDVSPSGAPLRLARITEVPGASTVPDYGSGTFSFVSQIAGVYYIQYLVTDGPQTVTGIVRVDVLEEANTDEKPIAVRDTALLPSGKEVRVDVLANDSDPSGGILVVQSVEVPQNSRVSVAVVDHRYLQITDQGGLDMPLTVRYRISNGTHSAEGDVIIIPVPAPAQLHPPVANDDDAVVRAGDIVTIPVLNNDYHPNGDLITLAPDLIPPIIDPADGMVFVSENALRFRAGPTPKTVYATYEIVDSMGQKDAGYVTIQILAVDEEANQAPRPRDLTGRVVAGSTVRIPVPLDGIDPDGDSVQLIGIASAPLKGRIAHIGQNWLEYEVFGESAGVDTFTYQVQDRLGRTATATVRVGIAPPDSANQAPYAVKDSVIVRPDRRVAVPVLVNDTDPEGQRITLLPDLEVPEGIAEASVVGDRVVVHTGEEPGTYTIQYAIRDEMGARAEGALVVTVDPNVPLLPPIARDDRITVAHVGDRTSIAIDVLENDEDPDGVKTDLALAVDDPDAIVGADGIVTVTLTEDPQIITYTVTDADGLQASAFILAPGTADLRPALRATGGIEVLSGEPYEIRLADFVVVAGGGRAIVTEAAKVQASHSNGQPLVKDATTLVYTSADRYFGQDAITFEVTDGTGPDDPSGRTATLTIPITVLPPENQAPTLTDSVISIAPGEDATSLALDTLTADPDPEDMGGHSYRLLGGAAEGFTARIDGTSLLVEAAADTPKGTVANFEVEVTDPEGLTGTGGVQVTVTASTRRLPVANDDVLAKAPQGIAQTIDVIANDDNPFPDTPLRVVDLEVESGEVATAPRILGDGQVEVTPGADFVGNLVVRYGVQDKTEDVDRRTEARILLTVQGRPEVPGTPNVTSVQDRTVVLNWTPPINNGAVITHYTVRSLVGDYVRECASTTCTLDGLTNNVEYNFTVTATNEVGESDPSEPSATARPDARPDTPQVPTISGFGDREITINWVTPPTPGSPVESFNLEISPAPPSGVSQRSVTGNSLTWAGLENGTNYTVRVQAVNRAPDPSSWSGWSAGMIPAAPPAAPPAPTTQRLSPVGNQAQLQVDWQEPAVLNGAPVDAYLVRVLLGGSEVSSMEVPGDRRSQAFNLNVSETDYTFTVTAKNKAGWGAVSAPSAPRRAFTAPSPPTVTGAAPADRAITFTATAGEGNGASQSELQYQYSLNGGTWTNIAVNRNGTALSGTIGGLSNGSTYSMALRAYTTIDGTNASNGSNTSAGVIPFGTPGQPTVNVSVSGQTVNFSWSAPAPNGRPVTLQLNTGSGWAATTATTYSTTPGYNSSATISVRAVDNEGQTGTAVSRTGNTGSPPAPTSWNVVPVTNTCPEDSASTPSHFNPVGPTCSAPMGWARAGTTYTVVCKHDFPASWSVRTWYRVSGGTHNGWFIASRDVSPQPTAQMPWC